MKIGLIAMSGIRVRTPELAELGVTLPQFVNRGKVIASLPSLGLLTVAALTPDDVEVFYREIQDVNPEDELELFDLVGIKQPVDQSGRKRIGWQEWPLINQPSHNPSLQVPPFSDTINQLLIQVRVERLRHFPMRRGHSCLCIDVGRSLIVTGVKHVRVCFNLVERAANEHLVICHPDEVQRTSWHQINLVSCRREVVLLGSPELEKRYDWLSRLAIIEYGIPDFLRLSPEQLGSQRFQDHPPDTGIDLSLSQAVYQ